MQERLAGLRGRNGPRRARFLDNSRHLARQGKPSSERPGPAREARVPRAGRTSAGVVLLAACGVALAGDSARAAGVLGEGPGLDRTLAGCGAPIVPRIVTQPPFQRGISR